MCHVKDDFKLTAIDEELDRDPMSVILETHKNAP